MKSNHPYYCTYIGAFAKCNIRRRKASAIPASGGGKKGGTIPYNKTLVTAYIYNHSSFQYFLPS
jgi:hypothetical protein